MFPQHMETSKYNWLANQLTGFYMTGNIDLRWVNQERSDIFFKGEITSFGTLTYI